MIRAARSHKVRAQALVLLKSVSRASVRRATSMATPGSTSPAAAASTMVPPNISLPPLLKGLTNTYPFMVPIVRDGEVYFDSPKDEKPPSKDKPAAKERSKRKEKDKGKEEPVEKKDDNGKNKDVNEPSKDIDSKPTADPNNPVSSSSKVSSGSAIDGVGDNNGNGNKPDGDDPDGSSHIKVPQATLKTGFYAPLLAIPMRDRPLLPGRPGSIQVTDPNVINCLKQLIQIRMPYFVLFHVRDIDHEHSASDVIPNKEFVHEIGTLCQITKEVLSPGTDSMNLLLYPHQRVKLVDLSSPKARNENIEKEQANSPTSFLKNFEVSYAVTEPLEDEPYDKNSAEIAVFMDEIKRICSKPPFTRILDNENSREIAKNPSLLADCVGSTVSGKPKQIQEILEGLNVRNKLERALFLLQDEANADALKQTAIRNIRERQERINSQNLLKEYINEILKVAKLSGNTKVEKFDERLKKLKMPQEALDAYNTEKAKLGTQSDMEQHVVERYLDWLTSIPFGVYSKDSFNVKRAHEILDRDHYGLQDVKDRILEFISVGKISGNVNGKILCLVGPPGTGKTSIAKSIAESLNRKYTRISVGGVQDVHDVKGHRRTYVASLPGRIIFALTLAKTSNPLMLIDEIDKLDTTVHGGAARAFLEVLDPEQNHSFVDSFIEVGVDLSKVLFVCTANYLYDIPPPLRDRMEIIEVNGYTKHDKIQITKDYLIPAAAKKVGLEEGHVVIPDETIARLIDKYCRESGLRTVKSFINRIFSKASRKIVEQAEENEVEESPKEAEATAIKAEVDESPKETAVAEEKSADRLVTAAVAPAVAPVKEIEDNVKDEEKPKEAEQEEKKDADEDVAVQKLVLPPDIKIVVTPETLKDYVGAELYTKDRLYETLAPGVATGLSVSSSGDGDAMYIESIVTDSIRSDLGNAGLHVTGSLKDVMKESSYISYSFAKQFISKKFPENKFFEAAHIHVHCPQGGIPKDGPSAGIAFTSSLISLALNKSLPNDVAMTGEITLTGKVLPIGGLREKSLGAKRAGYNRIIYPKDCQSQLDELPDDVKEGITYIPVEWYHEAYEELFKDVTQEEGNNTWKEEFAKLEETRKSKRKN
ncbi:Lon protease, mitochondrial [Candida viswanathii]|uniref:endopeptidase La n=1 Tax=Candida viswanathii TaxID=5486 RepID=A0A367XZE7_9ASCO|nr:Lon protease, mitochondrial [Candida viswanathii]